MTGPIYVCGAEPGDVLQVDILDLYPRKNPKTGKVRPHGSRTASLLLWLIGWHLQQPVFLLVLGDAAQKCQCHAGQS